MAFDVKINPLKPTIVHDPQAILDYSWDLTNLIDPADAIASAIFVSDAGVSVGSIIIQGAIVVGWVSITNPALTGTTVGISCRYTTVNGRTDDRTLYFQIKDR